MSCFTQIKSAFFLATLLVALPMAASAHENHAAAAKVPSELGAGATFDAEGRLWVVTKEAAGATGTSGTIGQSMLMLRASADFGKSWSAPVNVTTVPEAISARGENHPKIRAGRNGALYVSWTSPMAKRFSGNIRFARSLDGGKSFSTPITVNSDRREIGHNFDVLSVDAQGNVYLAWIDARERENARQAGKTYRGATLYAAISRDGGETFAPDFKLADHSCECCRLAMAPSASGGVYALWRHVFEPNVRDHGLLKISPDVGANVAAKVAVGNVARVSWEEWQLDACPHHGPSLVEDDQGTLHAVWFSLGKMPGVKYGRLRPGQPPEGLMLLGETGVMHADVAVYQANVALIWLQFDGQKTVLRMRRSADRGITWQDGVLAETTQAHEQPRLLQHAGRFYAFWRSADKPMQVIPLP